MRKLVALYRPVGKVEKDLISRSGWRRFPARLPGQPIFYPVIQREYAVKIARDWNAKYEGVGFVLRFSVDADFLTGYEPHLAGGKDHLEYWIPAEHLDELNANIVGTIEVVEVFGGSVDRVAP
jgi:hypothetical protein